MTMSREDAEALKQRVKSERGYWGPLQESLYRLDPAWLNAYLDFAGVRGTPALSMKEKHLILTAVDASVTHLYAKGLKVHMELAMKHGATRAELFEVLTLLCALGGMTAQCGVPILAEELARRGRTLPRPETPLTGKQERLKKAFIEKTGSWPQWLEALYAVEPQFAEGHLAFVTQSWEGTALSQKMKALIMIAGYAAPSTLNKDGVRESIGLALDKGATPREILETLHYASGIALHTLAVGAPILLEVADGSVVPDTRYFG